MDYFALVHNEILHMGKQYKGSFQSQGVGAWPWRLRRWTIPNLGHRDMPVVTFRFRTLKISWGALKLAWTSDSFFIFALRYAKYLLTYWRVCPVIYLPYLKAWINGFELRIYKLFLLDLEPGRSRINRFEKRLRRRSGRRCEWVSEGESWVSVWNADEEVFELWWVGGISEWVDESACEEEDGRVGNALADDSSLTTWFCPP